MNNKLNFLIAVLLVLGLMLSACAEATETTTEVPAEAAVEEPAEAAVEEPTEAAVEEPAEEPETLEAELSVIHWGSEEEKDLVADWIAQFNEEFPDITIEQIHVPQNYWDKVATMMAAGTPPDLMYMGYPEMALYASEGTLLPLDDYIDNDPDVNREMYFPALMDAFKRDGKLYGISKDWNTQVLYYNKTMFDEAGLSYPDDTWTWDDFLDAAKNMTVDANDDGIVDQWGFVTDVRRGA
jgi:multiple sugar transport system substrate-binding protein